MRNFLQVIRALAAEKNSRLVIRALAAKKNVFTLNSLSNPDGQPTVKRQSAVALQSGTRSEKAPLSPSCLKCASYLPPTCPRPDSLSLVSRQSDLDQVRAVSVGLSTRVWKHVAVIFAVLVMSMANVGMAWGGTKYYMFTPSGGGPAHTGSLSGQFICNQSPSSDTKTIDEVSFSHCVATTANTSLTASWTSVYAGTATIDYDMKTTAATFTVYAYNANGSNYGVCKAEVEEGGTPTSFSQVGTSFNKTGQKITFNVTTTKNKRVRIGNNSYGNVKFYQIVVEETGTPLVVPGESGYILDFTGKRFASKGVTKTLGTIDGMSIKPNSDIKYNGAAVKLTTKGTDYISFTAASACKLKVYVSTSKTYYVANSSTGTTNAQTSTHEFDLTAGTWYINPNGSDVTVTKIEFLTPSASDTYDIHIGKNNANYTDESLTNTSGSTWSKTITLDAGSYYEFKVKKTPTAGDAVWYGNNGRIFGTTSPAWDFSTGTDNCKLYTSVAGSYTFSWDASNNKLTITYPAGEHPTKRIYMACGSTWCNDSPKFFVHSWGVSDYNTQVQESTCDGYYADIIWYNDYFQFTRNASNATAYDNNKWNESQDLTYDSSKPLWTCTGYSDNKGTFTSSAYSPTTYTISYAKGGTTATGGAAISGSKANESKTCGVDFTLPSSAVFTATGYTQVGWSTTDGGAQEYALGGTYTTNENKTFYPVWEVEASLTALECNTLYKVEQMVPASITLSGTGQYGAGLSSNARFEVLGDPSKTKNAGGTPEMKTIDAVTIDGTSFPAAMYLKRAAAMSSSLPISNAVKFIVGTVGTLTMYVRRSDRLYLIKEGGSEVSLGSSDKDVKVEKPVTAGTYYIFAKNTSTAVYGIQLNCCSTPDAPTGFAAGSITSTGATFTITDAANAASYDIYYSTSNTAPDAGTAATTTSDSKTKAITGLTANTTYYAWVRSVCDASHKSAWVALSGSTFTTDCTDPVESATATPTSTTATVTLGEEARGYGYSIKLTSATGAGTFDWKDDAYNTYTLEGLTPSTTYTFHVKAYNAGKTCTSAEYTINFTTAAPAGDCEELFAGKATSTSVFTTTVGSATTALSSGNSFSAGGYSYSVKPNSTNAIVASPKAGSSFAAGDSLIVVIYNNESGAKNMGFTLGSGTYKTSVASKKLHVFRQKLVASDISAGKVTFNRQSSDDRWVEIIIKHCGLLPSCTTPVIPSLSNQSLCEGTAAASWDATQTASLETGETVSYQWQKKNGSNWDNITGATSATYDVDGSGTVTEAMAGTYRVVVTVSRTDYADAVATKEVTLSVTDGVEVTDITADKTTVYPTNSVTLTATASATATWQWYTCTNAEGDGEAIISGATSASYTIASAGVAGTYYYKAEATGDCGTGSMVYTLTVSAAAGGDCETYYFFANAADATTNGVTQNEESFFSGASEGTNNNSTSITVDGNNLSITKRTSASAYSVVFTIPSGATATLYTNAKANNASYPLTITRSSDSEVMEVTDQTALANYTLSDIPEGTWTLSSGSGKNWYYGAIIVKVCSGEACTDPEVTASVDNSTACVGTSVTFTATGAHASATYQWQKYSGGAWTDIDDATEATYNIASVATTDAMKYRVIASHDCDRTSNEVTLNVPVAPVFGSFTATRSVMATLALSITDVEASDATAYAWYKSADATYDAGTDTKVGTTQELLLASGGEAAGATYYLFCVASNACGSTTSSAITVNVTDLVEEDCATKGNEGAADFGFTKESGVGESSVSSQSCWTSGGKAKYLTYTAPDGKYFDNAKVTVAVSSGSVAAYGYSTDGSSYTYANLTGLSSALAEKTIDLPANVTHFRIGRNFDPSYGVTSGTFYLSKICFEYADACTATTVTPSKSSVNYEMGGAWTNPTFTVKHGGTAFDPQPTLSYSSSNEDIASVDDDGNVTFNGTAGTVTITAAYAGDATYCASEGSCTITVSCPGGAPKVVASGTTVGCSSSITLQAKTQADGDFADGTYQWFRNGTEIDGATSSSYTATQAGTYTVARTNTSGCISPSTNNATVTSATVEPEVTKLVPFHYYHVDKTYSAQMKDRHLFSVKGSAAYGSTGKNFKLELSRNGGAATDITTTASISVIKSADNTVDTVMIDLNKLSGKYSEGDELVVTCKAVDCGGAVSDTYKDNITIHVIGATPTLALICSGTDIAAGTRETKKLTVGGDFLTGYNVADLCQQTDKTSFDANTEWGLYTDLKAHYIVTPVNGYAVFNKLNYEPFDILLLTDYPKASKSDAAKDVLDDMADLCDYRPMLSFKAHMVAKSPSKWAAKGFTTSPVVSKADGRLNLNIVCYAHPMFASLTEGADVYKDNGDLSQLVYTMLSEPGYESSKGMQGFEIAAAENFVTIGLTHYNGTIAKNSPSTGKVTWTPNDGDRMLVTVAERQTNTEARFILFSINCGAQSKLTAKGEEVILACLEYLLDDDPLHVADCALTFDNGAGNTTYDAGTYAGSGVKGDGKWSTEANWGPQYLNIPGEFNSARIAAPVTVDLEDAKAMELRIVNEGSINIPAGKGLEVTSTIRRMEGSEIYPTEANDIVIGSGASGNGTLIFNNNSGDTKARVALYSTAKADTEHMSAATSTWQYIGTPHSDVASATSNYYGSWLYQYSGSGWEVIPNGGPLVPFHGYCVTHPSAPVVFDMSGTLAATTSADIAVPAGYTVIANSWTAPIDISTFTDADMENISDKTIYFFNTGTDVDGNHGTGTEPGTYVAVPKNSASYVGTWQIPSMQGFYISTTSDGTLHLDYDRHVRPTDTRTIVGNPMYAPRRVAAESDEPNVLKIFARGSRYQDKLVVLEREDFTRGYDSGWDGEAWGGGTLSPMVYVTGEGREDAVSAIPEFEGTVVAFKAGEDSEYRFEFIYSEDAEPLYLFDTENNTYTQIITGNAYYFTTTDKASHSRFILTRKAPQIATGVEDQVSSDQVSSTKARKLLIENKMYILLNGMLYDATGKAVQ